MVETLLYAGYELQFVDIDAHTLCLDWKQAVALAKDACAILFVHTYGVEDDYSDFELTLRPTPDFYTPLLSRGPLIKVLSPQWLADEIKKQHLEAAKLYEE